MIRQSERAARHYGIYDAHTFADVIHHNRQLRNGYFRLLKNSSAAI